MKPKERDELLIRLECKLNELKTDFENHLATHSKYTYLAISTALGMIATLFLTAIKSFIK